MHRVVRFAVILHCLIAGTMPLFSQDLSILDVDASSFPEMRVKFLAVDAAGSIATVAPSDIALSDNGFAVGDFTVACALSERPVPLSSVLVIDVSGSMRGNNILVARAGAHAWIKSLTPGRSECAITSFDDENYLNQDFTADHALLHTAVDKLAPRGNTSYNNGLLLPPAGGLHMTARGKHRRVIVFLTDGVSTDSLRTDDIITEARRQGAVIYPVTLGLACPPALQEIARQTGGEWFEHVTTVAEIEKIYRMLALGEQNPGACEVTWRSPDICSAAPRTVRIGWQGSETETTYRADSSRLQSITFAPESSIMVPIGTGIPVETTVTVTATRRSAVRSITSSNPAFTVTPTTFWLDEGESTTLTVRYTPIDSSYQWTTLSLRTDNCIDTFYASAGYSKSLPLVRTLAVTHPNGGEVFPVGKNTVITWSGIPPADKVRLEYSTDDGATWSVITDEATGGRQEWQVPNTPSPLCRVRVTQRSSAEGKEWVRTIGSPSSETARSVVVDAEGNSYICGSFRGTIQVGGQSLTSIRGTEDIYIARYNRDGTPEWAVAIGGRSNDYPGSIALDDAGNIVIGGTCGADTQIGPHRSSADSVGSYSFVAKLTSGGLFIWARSFGVSSGVASIDVDSRGEICITGAVGSRTVTLIDFDGIPMTILGARDAYLAKLRDDGSMIWARRIGGYDGLRSLDNGYRVRFDRDGDILLAGGFGDTVDFGGTRLVSTGEDDMFLARYSGNGDLEWARRGGGLGHDRGYALAVDSLGNIYVGGSTSTGSATVTFDHLRLPANDWPQMFVAKYRSHGEIEWLIPFTSEYPDDNTLWSIPMYQVDAIAVDGIGDIYVATTFRALTNFQGTRLQSRAFDNIGVARLRPDGSSVWARRAGTSSKNPMSGQDQSSDIAVAPDGSVFVAGSIHDRLQSYADFGGDTVPGAGERDAFLWKISHNILQIDSSDAPFAIVASTAASQSVHFGPVILGDSHDSVVTAFVRNTGTWPLLVEQITLEGTDADAFSLVSGHAPFVITPGDSRSVEFRFEPYRLGLFGAWIHIVASGDTLKQRIFGEGVEPMVDLPGDLIDFGRVPVGSSRDTLQAVTITNRGSSPVTLTAIRHDGPNSVDFTTLAGARPTLLPGDTLRLDLRFAPASVGRTSGQLVFEFDGIGSPASVQLFGEGVTTTPASASLVLNSFQARAGEEIDLPVLLGEQINIEHSGATSIATTLRFNASLLYPITVTPDGAILDVGEIVDGERVMTIEMPLPAGAGGILGNVRFMALLGNDSTTTVAVGNTVSIGGDVALTSNSAQFRLLDLCYEGGARLYNPDGQTAILKVQTERGGLTAEVEIETVENGQRRLVLVDMLGREVMVLVDGEEGAGRQHYTIDTRSLSTGSYYIVLTTQTVRRVARLNVSQ